MEMKDILSISGQSGLYKYVSQSKNGLIVESLENQKRMNAFASQKISSLEDIAIFTSEKEAPLAEVFKKIFEKEKGAETIDPKSKPEDLKKYFAELMPEYDREKVYSSDIKKVVSWYNLLLKYKIMGPALWEEKKEKKGKTKEKEEDTEKHFEGVKEPKTPVKKQAAKKVKQPVKHNASAGKSGGRLKNVGVKKT